MKSRLSHSIKNSKVALIYSVCVFIVGFFSRKIFLDHLGADVLGLNTTATNILQFINLAEMGVGAAIAVTLYKPIFNNDKDSINEIISVQGWLYRRIAYIMIGAGVVVMAFFPLIFEKSTLPLWYAYATFSVLLFSSLLSYFVNYKSMYLSANQQEYVVIMSHNSVRSIIKSLFQLTAIALLSNGYIWWLVIEFIFTIISSVTLNIAIKREAPWLKPQIKRGRELSKKYPDILTKIKQVFFHKIGGFVLRQTQPLIVYGFTSLALVAYYGNYLFIITGLTILINALFNGIGASVGNLVAQGDRKSILRVFDELFSSRFLLTSILCITTYYVTPLFITLWIGKEYLLENSTLILMLAAFFITGIRSTVENFAGAYGLYRDIWAPIAEAILNIGLSVLLGAYYGLNGVLIGSLLSLVIMILGWKPYFLFKAGMEMPYRIYLTIFSKHILVLGCIIAGLLYIDIQVPGNLVANPYANFLIVSTIVVVLSTIVMGSALYIASKGMRDFTSRILGIVKRKFNK